MSLLCHRHSWQVSSNKPRNVYHLDLFRYHRLYNSIISFAMIIMIVWPNEGYVAVIPCRTSINRRHGAGLRTAVWQASSFFTLFFSPNQKRGILPFGLNECREGRCLSDSRTSFLNPLLSPPPRLLIWSPPTPRRPPLTCHTLGRVAHARVTGRALHSARLVSPAHLCTSRSRQHSSFQIPTLALFCGLDLNVYKTKEISEKLQLSF